MNKILDLRDFTIVMVVRLDSIDRLENILLSTSHLLNSFKTNIFVFEFAAYKNGILERILSKKINYCFIEDDDPIFYRTCHLNNIVSHIATDFIAIWDVDVLIPKSQIIQSVEILRNGIADFVYPYENQFLDTTPILKKLYFEKQKIEFLELNKGKMKELFLPKPSGGVFLANTTKYKNAGCENLNYYGWGMEDGDRIHRWRILDYKIRRVNGPLFHLSHSKGINSTFINSDKKIDKFKEFFRIRRKNKLELLLEIENWKKTQQVNK